MQTLYSHYRDRFHGGQAQINAGPVNNLQMIITIPAHNEPDILTTLAALQNCDAPTEAVEVIVCVNAGTHVNDGILATNQRCEAQVRAWADVNSNPMLSYHVFADNSLTPKHAGVGLARKRVMDEAARRFALLDRPEGIIVGLDADSSVDPNYLNCILEAFRSDAKMPAASIHYEHPLQGNSYPAEIYSAITEYELHLRAYVAGLRSAAYPYAFHTIGSSFAVRADVYCRAGGMNKRKAAEDFYFLQKLFPLGHYGEILDTRVIPSPRISDRVPFGTGKAVGDWVSSDEALKTYDPRSYKHVQHFCESVRSIDSLQLEQLMALLQGDALLWEFLLASDFQAAAELILQNSSGPGMLRKKLFDWLNNLRVLKCIHFVRDAAYPPVSLATCAAQLLQPSPEMSALTDQQKDDLTFLLESLRKRQSTKPAWSSVF